MKDRSQLAIQYSGYPLSVAEIKQKPSLKPGMSVVKPLDDHTTSVQKNRITNDPVNWDENWFSNYE